MVRYLGLGLAALGILGALSACRVGEEGESSEDAVSILSGPSLYRPGNRFAGWGGPNGPEDHYLDKVQPVIAKRCVTCHGCTTAACQLKLTSYEGIKRGANAHNFFDSTIFSAPTGPTRLKDGVTAEDWKAKGFYSVVDGGKDSIMYKMLEHGNEDNRGDFDLSGAFGLYADGAKKLKFACLDSNRKLDERLSKKGTGMPFGLPALPSAEYTLLTQWIENGAPGPSAEAQKILATARDAQGVQEWEDFFNQASPKARLSMRYVFEHLFYSKVHLDDRQASRGDFFEVVRSRTKTGPIDEIVTERPSDDPKVAFYYRFKKHTQIITAKDHTVFHLDANVRRRWKELFLDSAWEPGEVPGYGEMNPFIYFDKIPGKIRYQFMLENSHHLIEAMVKGDVCNGSSATYAIRDRFFTVFLKPESDPSAIDPKLGESSYFHLDPNSGSIFRDVDFEQLFEKGLRKLRPEGLGVEDIWDGGKKDKNAWITVFRHGNNASAHQGVMGQLPETMWVLDFGNFERLYYDLVVLYRPWGAIPHKLSTWRQMSHVRAHSEDLFLLFLPERFRNDVRKEFTPGWGRFTEIDMAGTDYPSRTNDLDATRPATDFVGRLRDYLGPTIAGATKLDPEPMRAAPPAPTATTNRDEVETALYQVTLDRGNFSADLPDVTWLTVDAGSQQFTYTLLANRIFWHNSRVLGDALPNLTRRPEQDSISVVRGHIGAFPQLFLRVPVEQVGALAKASREGREQRLAIRKKHEILRSSPDFWKFLDDAHTSLLEKDPVDAGIIDTSRYLWPVQLERDASGFED